MTLYNLYKKSSPHPITVWALSQERWHVGDNGLFIWWDARHICEKKLQWFIWHWNVAGFCGWRACCSERVELHWDKPLSSIHLIFSFRSTVLPSGSSRGVTSRLRWAIVNASCRFSVGFLVRLSLRSTKSGFMDLIIARNARPFLQLLPKSFTSTPNLHVWNYKKMGFWMIHWPNEFGCGSDLLWCASLDPLEERLDGLPMVLWLLGSLSPFAWQCIVWIAANIIWQEGKVSEGGISAFW